MRAPCSDRYMAATAWRTVRASMAGGARVPLARRRLKKLIRRRPHVCTGFLRAPVALDNDRANPLECSTYTCVLMLFSVVAALKPQAVFGGNAVVTKLAIRKADPVVFSARRGRRNFAAARMQALRHLCRATAEDYGTFILLGVLGVYIAMMFQALALQYVEPLNASLLQPSQPVLTTFLRRYLALRHSKSVCCTAGSSCLASCCRQLGPCVPSTGTAAAVAVGLAPAAGGLAAYGTETPSAHQVILGNGLLLVQCTAGALYQLVQKHLLSTADYPPLCVAALGYLIGAVAVGLVLPVCSLDSSAWAFLWRSRTAGLGLAYSIVLTSALNYGLQAYANKHSSPVLVTAFFPLQTVFTAIFSWLVFNRRPSSYDGFGALMIVGGLAAVTAGRVLQARRAKRLLVQAADDGRDVGSD